LRSFTPLQVLSEIYRAAHAAAAPAPPSLEHALAARARVLPRHALSPGADAYFHRFLLRAASQPRPRGWRDALRREARATGVPSHRAEALLLSDEEAERCAAADGDGCGAADDDLREALAVADVACFSPWTPPQPPRPPPDACSGVRRRSSGGGGGAASGLADAVDAAAVASHKRACAALRARAALEAAACRVQLAAAHARGATARRGMRAWRRAMAAPHRLAEAFARAALRLRALTAWRDAAAAATERALSGACHAAVMRCAAAPLKGPACD
jgi:hypothetical protein